MEKKMEKKTVKRTVYVMNEYHVKVKKCCASWPIQEHRLRRKPHMQEGQKTPRACHLQMPAMGNE